MFRVYIANLGKYNEGELVGKWVDLPVTEEKLEAVMVEIKVAHYDENGVYRDWYCEDGIIYEETAIHDYENDFGLEIGEWDNIMELSELAEEFDNLDDYEKKTVEAFMEAISSDFREALDRAPRCLLYEDMEMVDVARMIVEDCYELPDFAERYFDYEAFARDLSLDRYTETSVGVLYY